MKQTALPVIHTKVFGYEGRGGNPCPVVLNGDFLETSEMQSAAARFGAETGFIVKPSVKDADARFRYFVPNHEMEMCVHATIGAVTVLIKEGNTPAPLHIQTPLGIRTADWVEKEGLFEITVDQFAPVFSCYVPPVDEIAKALGISTDCIDREAGPIESVSTSRSKLMIPIKDYDILDSIDPDYEKLWALCDEYNSTGFYPFTVRARNRAFQVEARQFPRRAGFNEDPATGVAACSLGSYLTQHNVLGKRKDGWNTYTIGQGFAMGSPSIIKAESYWEKGSITLTRVGGNAAITSYQTISIGREGK